MPAETWPARWELNGPETHVLYYRGGAAAPELLRLAVIELVARRVLRLEEVEPARRMRPARWALMNGSVAGRGVEPPLDVIFDLVARTRRRAPRDGVLVEDLRKTIRKEFRHLDDYRTGHVAPLLVDRGLLRQTRGRRHSRAAEFDWTAAGREADAQLGRWLELGSEHLADWVAKDPARAAAFTREAGAAVFLMRGQYPALEELSRHHGIGVAEGGGGETLGFGHPAAGHAGALDPTAGHHAAFGDGSHGFGAHGFDLGGLGLDFGGLMDLGGGLGDLGGGGGHGGGGDGGGGGGGGN